MALSAPRFQQRQRDHRVIRLAGENRARPGAPENRVRPGAQKIEPQPAIGVFRSEAAIGLFNSPVENEVFHSSVENGAVGAENGSRFRSQGPAGLAGLADLVPPARAAVWRSGKGWRLALETGVGDRQLIPGSFGTLVAAMAAAYVMGCDGMPG